MLALLDDSTAPTDAELTKTAAVLLLPAHYHFLTVESHSTKKVTYYCQASATQGWYMMDILESFLRFQKAKILIEDCLNDSGNVQVVYGLSGR